MKIEFLTMELYKIIHYKKDRSPQNRIVQF